MQLQSLLAGRFRVLLIAAAFGILGAAPLAAQATGTVRGTVRAANTMRPLAGAQVSVAGTGRGTLSNASGQFLIPDVPAGPQTVRVQILGFGATEQTITVTAGQSAALDFELSESAIALDEVIVTGVAGATTKRSIGNAVTSVKAEAIVNTAPVNDVQELLTARAPGLTLLSNSGQAGAGSRIRIRGAGSLSGRLEPVVYVDGIRMYSGVDEQGFGTGGGTVQGTSPLDAINPNDIESIEVIKGPAAATLYGADAASGVIQIITKKGRGVSGVDWTASIEGGSSNWELETPTNYWLCTPAQIGNASQYPGCAALLTTLGPDAANAPAEQRLLQENVLRGSYECQFTDDCQPNPIRDGDFWGFNISARGGGEAYNFFVSGERNAEDGIFYNNYQNRTAGRGNFGFTPSEKLNFAVNMSYTQSDIAMPLNNNASNSVLRNAFRYRPGVQGPYAVGWRGFSPELSNSYDNVIEEERVIIGVTTNYTPISWFTNRLTVGLDKSDRNNTLFYEVDRTGVAPWGAIEATGEINQFLPSVHVWTLDYAGTVTNDLTPDISSAFSGGVQVNAYKFHSFLAIGEGLVASSLNLVGAAADTRADEDIEEQTSAGFFVQEQLSWKNRLFGTVAVRFDDNSAFGENFDRVVYPKASLSYVISDEDFFSFPAVNDLKLRAAWGRAGNAPEPFSADRTLGPSVAIVGDVAVNQLGFSDYGNPDLRAETGQEFELGFDAGFLQGRLGAELTYYNKTTKDALISIPDPRSAGFEGTHLENIGEINNQGLELLLTGSPVAMPNVQWDSNLTFASNKNELISFGGGRDEIVFGSFADVQKHIEGYPLGGFWAKDVVRDASGNPVLTANGGVTVSDEFEYVGPMLPTREIAFTNTVTLFNVVRLFGNLDYKAGHYQWCAICSINNRIDLNTWEVNNPNADPVDVAIYRSLQTKTHIAPADFLKLRELSATLLVPANLSQRFGAGEMALTLSGRNLWMWTKYDDQVRMKDPEVVFNSSSNFTSLDYGSTPMIRRLVLSARVSF